MFKTDGGFRDEEHKLIEGKKFKYKYYYPNVGLRKCDEIDDVFGFVETFIKETGEFPFEIRDCLGENYLHDYADDPSFSESGEELYFSWV